MVYNSFFAAHVSSSLEAYIVASPRLAVRQQIMDIIFQCGRRELHVEVVYVYTRRGRHV
jgi:hypothetical protein